MDKRYNILYRCAFTKQALIQDDIEQIRELYGAEGKEKIKQAATKRKFLPFVANLLLDLGYSGDGWEDIIDSYTKRNRIIINGLNAFYEALEKNGLNRVVVVENFGAFLSAGADPLWRFASGDIDLYGDIKQKEAIYEAARNAGFAYEERYTGRNLISTSFRNDKILPENFYIDIGWYPTARLKVPFLNYKEEAVDWKNTRYYKDTKIRLPDIESLLYICMLHISVHNFSREPDIRLYIDIQNCIEGKTIDWSKIINWAKRDGYKNRISTVGYLTNMLIGNYIPESIIHLCDNANHRRLVSFVYNEKDNCLVSKPGGIDSLRIEMYSHDSSRVKGLCEILFPSGKWLHDTYGLFTPVTYFRYLSALVR